MSVRSRVLIVIPARYDSVRFPGKPLVRIAGVSLIERVYRLCRRVRGNPRVIVATDDARIEQHVQDFGGEVCMTRRNHPSGTDRVAEVARKISCPVVINVQGDEPLLDPRLVRTLADTMLRQRTLPMATLCHAIASSAEYRDPNVVKVTMDREGNALYFSRSPMPHFREGGGKAFPGCWRHIGIYAYRREFLLDYVRWRPCALEKSEKLEQLRALDRRIPIRVLKTHYRAIGVDVPSDVRKVEKLLRLAESGRR